MEKIDLAKKQEWYKIASTAWDEWRVAARKDYKYYMGDQWDPATVQALRKGKRPALTINRVKPTIRTLSGYMRQNRRDMKVLARRGGAQGAAEIYTHLMKHTYDQSYAEWYEAQAFLDGIICGKGWLWLDVDYEQDPISGQIVIGREDPFLILEDPFSVKYDLSDARFVFRLRWMDKDQIISLFPEAKGAIDKIDAQFKTAGEMDIETDDYTDVEAQEMTEVSKLRYLIKECWYKTYSKKKMIVHKKNGTIDSVDNYNGEKLDEDAIQIILDNDPDTELVTRTMPTLHLTIILGDEELHHEDDPYNGMTRFPGIRFADELVYAEKPMIRGEVCDIIGAQDELNKRRSQALHLLNTTANSGYMAEEGALSENQFRKLESMGSKPGVVVQTKQGKLNAIKRIEPAQLSTGHVNLSQLSDEDIKSISGINANLLGSEDTKATSGIAMEMQRRQGLINVEPVFDNFDFTLRVLGDTMLEVIRNTDVYTPEEIADLIGDKAKLVDGTILQPEDIHAFMRSRRGQYGVKVSDQNANPTQRKAEFREMLESIQTLGIPVPPEMLLEASDFPFKDELLAQMANAQQQGPQLPPEAQPTQVQGDPVQAQVVADITGGVA